jgi:ABC-type dipeptide/oligopeptide/nickel transport system ATPase component
MADLLLQVRDLKTQFVLKRGVVRSVDGVDFESHRGETLGLVGESGSGKSVTAASLLRLVPPPGRIVSGEIMFEGRDLLKLSAAEMAALRGRDLGLITQDPMTSLDPVFTVGYQIEETLRQHSAIGSRDRKRRTVELLRAVQISERCAHHHP